jgi:hypothetical protein
MMMKILSAAAEVVRVLRLLEWLLEWLLERLQKFGLAVLVHLLFPFLVLHLQE